MKLGDLISYNCAGQFKKTIGLVLKEWFDDEGKRYVMIKWGMKGEVLPRASYDYYQKNNLVHPQWTHNGEEGNKEYIWYDADKDYFKVIT
tara:strand:+ start:1484 stop:1753 length:270 start_codon:yes stop_codon:yes gene_type:complete